MKLSPNLRKALKVGEEEEEEEEEEKEEGFNYWNSLCLFCYQEKNRTEETEKAKMEKLINFVKEPLLEKENESSS